MESQRVITLGTKFKEAGSSGRKAHVIVVNGKWAVLKEGANKVVATYPSKISAIQKARSIVSAGQSDKIVVHKADGTVEKIQSLK